MGDVPSISFSEACGLDGPLRVRLEADETAGMSEFEFTRPFFVIGRDESADLTIDSPAVSRRHAYFQVVAGRIFCVDLASRSGIRWHDGLRAVGWINRTRGVDVGPARILFEGEDQGLVRQQGSVRQADSLPISRSFVWPSLPVPDARLEFLGTRSDGTPWQFNTSLVLLGRSPTCRIRLDSLEIAKFQAALIRTPAGIWAVDLLGRTDGLRVEGVPTRSARLEDGDVIGLGKYRILVRIGEAARPSASAELVPRPKNPARPAVRANVGNSSSRHPEAGRVTQNLADLKGSLDPLSQRLFDQFERMHQETNEQFRQAILMMFQMHQDQMEVIRQKLSRLDQLEEDQKSLMAEMVGGNLSRLPRTTLRLVSGEGESATHTAKSPSSGRIQPEADRAPGSRPSEPPASVTAMPVEVAPPAANREAGVVAAPLFDPHEMLSRKLAEIQNERQGLWKKLLGSITGGESETVLP